MDYYLRLEAVNLGNFIYDTQDLSTVRGASLVLLDMVEKLTTIMQHSKPLVRISSGASTGLYQFAATDDDDAERFRREIEDVLNADQCVKHATFVVDVYQAGQQFGEDREKLLALNRWRQMRQPAVAVPSENELQREQFEDRTRYTACEIDHLRPGTETMDGAANRIDLVSASVKPRREFGREQKRSFYQGKTGVNATSFTKDFDELTSQDRSSGDVGNLDLKMAVIYIDGNKFGKRQSTCQHPSNLTAWDVAIQGKRNQVLKGLLLRALDEENGKGWRCNNGAVRFETLLWGGDDLLWVVPAWKGIEALIHFFTFREHPDRAFWNFDDAPLTHAAGVVFCHRNAPIYRIRRLADDLARLAKEKSRDQNLVAYEVLESFDHTGPSLKSYRERWFPRSEGTKELLKELILPGDELGRIIGPFGHVKRNFPKRQLHRIVQRMVTKPKEAEKLAEKVIESLDENTKTQLMAVESCFGTTMTRWIHLAELWDYL